MPGDHEAVLALLICSSHFFLPFFFSSFTWAEEAGEEGKKGRKKQRVRKRRAFLSASEQQDLPKVTMYILYHVLHPETQIRNGVVGKVEIFEDKLMYNKILSFLSHIDWQHVLHYPE